MRAISQNKNDAPRLRRSKFVVTKIRFIARRPESPDQTTVEVERERENCSLGLLQCRIKDIRPTGAQEAKSGDYYRMLFVRQLGRCFKFD